MSRIPDLRNDPEITLEHCSVLLERIGKTLDLMDGQSGFNVTNAINPELLLEHYQMYFQPAEFQRMFMDEMGKGVLVGTFVQKLLDQMENEEIDG